MKKKPAIYSAISVIVLAAFVLFVSPLITVKTLNGWTCAFTGSHKGYARWFGLLQTGEWQRVSPIETWLAQQGQQIEHRWVRTRGTHYSLIGGVHRRHARAPAMYHFMHELQEVYVETASEEEILTFLETVKNSPRDEAKELVDEVAHRMIEKM